MNTNFWIEIDKRINNAIKNKSYQHNMAVVTAINAGSVDCYLPTDPSHDFTVQNPNEIPCEVGDQISIGYRYGCLNSAVVEFRKTIMFNNVYVDYSTGIDAYTDSNGNLCGTSSYPFQTLQYAVERLPQNFNGREITINIVSMGTWSFYNLNTSGYHGGILNIIGNVEIGSFYLGNSTITLNLSNISFFNGLGAYHSYFLNCTDVRLYNCDFYSGEFIGSGDVSVYNDGSNVRVEDCYVSSEFFYSARTITFVKSINQSRTFCKNNSGGVDGMSDLRNYDISENSTLGRIGTEPTSTLANVIDASSVIRP